MGLITKEVEVRPNGTMIQYYKDLGYDAKYLQPLTVKIEDLKKNSTALVETECDYCGKLRKPIKYVDYNAQTKYGTEKCCCLDCVKIKREEVMVRTYGYKSPFHSKEIQAMIQENNQKKYGSNSPTGDPEVRAKQKETLMKNYGVTNPSLSKEIQEKRKQTFMKRFGVESPLFLSSIREKAAQTNLERYGVENVFFSKEIQDKKNSILIEKYGTQYPLQNEKCLGKMKQTNLEKYGVECVLQSEEVREKCKITNLEKYGYENPMQSPEFFEKWFERNGSNFARTSKQQRYLCELYNGVLNHPFRCFALDVYLPEDNLDVEFDGSGHRMSISLGNVTEEEFENKELYRNVALKREGYKQMRIISTTDLLPKDETLLQMLTQAKEYFSTYPQHSWYEYNIDTSTVRNAEQKEGVFFDYGELRRITEVA